MADIERNQRGPRRWGPRPQPRGTLGTVSLAALAVVAVMAGLMIGAPGAAAQVDDDVTQSCALYISAVGTGGEFAVERYEALRTHDAPSPTAVEDAFEVLIAFEHPDIDDPAIDTIEAAYDVLNEYYGPVCEDVDICPLLASINGADPGDAATAASLLFGLSTPAPPGIGAALAVLAGDIEPGEAGLGIASEAAARERVNDWFGGACRLAVTGPGAVPVLLSTGVAAVALGAAFVAVSRRPGTVPAG